MVLVSLEVVMKMTFDFLWLVGENLPTSTHMICSYSRKASLAAESSFYKEKPLWYIKRNSLMSPKRVPLDNLTPGLSGLSRSQNPGR